MRYVIELEHSAGAHVAGWISLPGSDEPVAFSGWLELLRLLEPRLPDPLPPARPQTQKDT